MTKKERALTIVTHNIYWFQGIPCLHNSPADPQQDVLDGLVQLYKTFSADVVCLQEVHSASALLYLKNALQMNAHHCPGLQYPEYGGGILSRLGNLIAESKKTDGIERVWQKLQIPEIDGLTICNVHLPSGRQSTDSEAAEKRLQELRGLLDAPSKPDVIVGDFNERPEGNIHPFMEEQGYKDVALLFNSAHIGTSTQKEGRRTDYIWIHKRLSKFVINYRVASKSETALDSNRFLSDHLPVLLTLKF